ncbi:MAG: hypothetical protein ACD_77C00146G0002 [uncultured bacterium]|nr:MAG: hypothetical protein ACD_77C00146G0002 [uncultured bacterium]
MGSLPCKIILKAKKPCHKPYPKELISYGDHIRKKRIDFNITQKEVAEIVNVTEDTIVGWETDRHMPKTSYIPRIISYLEYSPLSYVNNLKRYRIERGLTIVKLAKMLKVDTRTIANIENGNKVREDVMEKINYIIKYAFYK